MLIGELAHLSGVTAKTIRFYETAGVLSAPVRTSGGYRDYEPAALDRLAFVKAAQACGLTLTEVREIITVRSQAGPPCEHVVDLLDRRANELVDRIADLQRVLAEVTRLRARATTLNKSDCGAGAVCNVITSS